MSGELSLSALLSTLNPKIQPTTFVWATLANSTLSSLPGPLMASALFTFAESEGLSLIVPQDIAREHNIPYIYPSRQITLDVHSSLEAVGFMAAISARLAKAGFSSNPVSAYFHDHLFVKVEEAEKIVQVLKDMASEAA
ncbi:uncharacterized protein HMPREF1541_08042 [Cyphellophora europaea CBS 101466]|uniref:DUF2241 domain-containing protein n=1 Tax=Cyphellophora europaea (strain CBS 101466) TaxID=1220924 RepID=W2RKN4_CYPE1|nr:uncharacterized protein HMPREF1541_08042 [Cyphellophora europaea CBS 101466]ETN37052.1 hypothetical protein HMPREF1541_08042 [Cyphellophora europaea CBS 101466]